MFIKMWMKPTCRKDQSSRRCIAAELGPALPLRPGENEIGGQRGAEAFEDATGGWIIPREIILHAPAMRRGEDGAKQEISDVGEQQPCASPTRFAGGRWRGALPRRGQMRRRHRHRPDLAGAAAGFGAGEAAGF